MANRKKKSLFPKSKFFQTYNNFLVVGCVLGFLILVVLAAAFAGKTNTRTKILLNPRAIAQEHLPLTITPFATPTSTPTPTLTPVPTYTGYCLRVPVLMYHHIDTWEHAKEAGHTALTVDASIFDQQMSYLKAQGYTSYFANDLVNALVSHSSLAGKPIIVTIDDGYDDVYSYAFPVLKKYGVKATLFIPTGLLGGTVGPNEANAVKRPSNSGKPYLVALPYGHARTYKRSV
jgi:hypothetical protein